MTLGAYLELAHTFPALLAAGGSFDWLDSRHFRRYLTDRGRPWFVEDPYPHGFIPIPSMVSSPLVWTEMINRLKRLSIGAGFSDDHSGKFVAAIDELWCNVVDHSQRSDTGYVGFSLEPGRFEFVVADHGVGILASLNSNPIYADLKDHGRAIELALSEGISRYHKDDGHGFGFRPLFIGLANIARDLRFRSGDHAREITRVSGAPPEARTYEIAPLPGFFCSTTCVV